MLVDIFVDAHFLIYSKSNSNMQGKRTADGVMKKRSGDLHRLLFMPKGLPDGAKLDYRIKQKTYIEGYKQRNGIVCGCCKKELSPSQFENHAGLADRRQPYRHIYTPNGLTLHDIALSLANGLCITTSSGDDLSAVSEKVDLLLSHEYRQAFDASRIARRPIVRRLTRAVEEQEFEIGCVICRKCDFIKDPFCARTIIMCDQREKEFHIGCLRDYRKCDLKEKPKDEWLCSDDCRRIYETLKAYVSKEFLIKPTSNIIKIKHSEKRLFFDEATNSVQWQILRGKNNDLSLLTSVAALFDECFDPLVADSGGDFIGAMVHGREISGQEFGGMHCVVLLRNKVVVSAGLLRIFGSEIAELPLVATTRKHRGKGYFQTLFACIEGLLCSLRVENLILPAAEEALPIWTEKFGFEKMDEEELMNYQKMLQVTLFNGTSMLVKKLPQHLPINSADFLSNFHLE